MHFKQKLVKIPRYIPHPAHQFIPVLILFESLLNFLSQCYAFFLIILEDKLKGKVFSQNFDVHLIFFFRSGKSDDFEWSYIFFSNVSLLLKLGNWSFRGEGNVQWISLQQENWSIKKEIKKKNKWTDDFIFVSDCSEEVLTCKVSSGWLTPLMFPICTIYRNKKMNTSSVTLINSFQPLILIQTVKDQKNIEAGRDLERSMIMMRMLPNFCELLQCCQFSTRNCDVCLEYFAAFLVKVIQSPIDAPQFFEVLC